jgi:hypothetical protein
MTIVSEPPASRHWDASDAVLGLTARVQRFGGYATDEVALAPEPFDARRHLVRILAIDLVQELVRIGRA